MIPTSQLGMDEVVQPPGDETGADQCRDLHGGVDDVGRGEELQPQPVPQSAQPDQNQATVEEGLLHERVIEFSRPGSCAMVCDLGGISTG